jgi:hypothetical protein
MPCTIAYMHSGANHAPYGPAHDCRAQAQGDHIVMDQGRANQDGSPAASKDGFTASLDMTM